MQNELRFMICPNCQAPLAEPDKVVVPAANTQPKLAALWSDGAISSRMDPFFGSVASCPQCWAVFSRFQVEDFLKANSATVEQGVPRLVFKAHGLADNSGLPIDPSRKLVRPSFKTWRLTPLDFGDGDPIMFALAAESYMHINNDRLRNKVLANESAQLCIFDKEGPSDELQLFVARVKNGMINLGSYSATFNSTVEDFFGVYRLYFLCAEISRSIRKFEWADEFIKKIEIRRQTVPDFAEDLWEHPREVDRVEFPTLVWLARQSEFRLQVLKNLVATRNPFLATVLRSKL